MSNQTANSHLKAKTLFQHNFPEVPEHVIHKGLNYGWDVHEAKWHDQTLKVAKMGGKCCLSFILLSVKKGKSTRKTRRP